MRPRASGPGEPLPPSARSPAVARSFGSPRQLHLKESHPAWIWLEGHWLQIGKHEAIKDRRLVPGQVIEMASLIAAKGIERTIVQTLEDLALADNTADDLGGLQHFR